MGIHKLLTSPDVLSGKTSFFDYFHNIVIAVDYQGRLIIFNSTCERVFGIKAEDVLGRLVSEVIPYTGLLKVLKTGKSHIGRKFVVGNTLYIANRTPIIQDGAIVGVLGVAQEVSELQHVAEELESARKLNDIMEHVLDNGKEAYLAIDREGTVVMLNTPMTEILGVQWSDAVGKHVTQVIPDSKLQLIPVSGKEQDMEVILIDGKQVLVSHYPMFRGGKIAGAVCKVLLEEPQRLMSLAGVKTSTKIEQGPEIKNRSGQSKGEGARYKIDSLIGQSTSMIRLKETIARVARGPSTVLINGESGTGKELMAHAMHLESARRNKPFVKVNCAAVPETLLESELFGYQEGAFTGARRGGQVGKFELADEGTIFLDEIGDMPFSMQAKLLRVLQEKEIERLGESRTRHVDVRVVTATNRNLRDLIKEGKFREDLYYRINVVSLTAPPLRERMEDLGELTQYFVKRFNHSFNLKVVGISREVLHLFNNYHWPGNVRELENIVERAFNLVDGDYINTQHMPHYLQQHEQSSRPSVLNKNLPTLLEQVEKDALQEALDASGGNKMQAAKILGISRAWLYKKMKYYDIDL